MKRKCIFAALILCAASSTAAQPNEPQTAVDNEQPTTLNHIVKNLSKINISGNIQAQYQYANYEADNINFKLANNANAIETQNKTFFGRFGIRRGNIRFAYKDGIVQGVFQPDFSDRGVALKDAYISISDPWIGTNSLRAGIFDIPFGYEVSYSPLLLESMEKARIVQSLFPEDRDMGAVLTLQAAKTSAWHTFKLEAGLLAGNGIRPQIDSRMNFAARLSVARQYDGIAMGAGVSAYLGSIMQVGDSVYVMRGKTWELDAKYTGKAGKYLPRQYFGVDLQAAVLTALGQTQVRAEYIFGRHAGTAAGAYDFRFAGADDRIAGIPKGNVYMRRIAGGYVLIAQDVWRLPLRAVFKYDWYDPNTNVNGSQAASAGDIRRYNFGVGLHWNINAALRLTCYYDFVNNEKSGNTAIDYNRNHKDNVLTLRLQYKF